MNGNWNGNYYGLSRGICLRRFSGGTRLTADSLHSDKIIYFTTDINHVDENIHFYYR